MVKKFDIHVKGGFSERKGLKKISDLVQITSLNERTRNKIYTDLLKRWYNNAFKLSGE